MFTYCIIWHPSTPHPHIYIYVYMHIYTQIDIHLHILIHTYMYKPFWSHGHIAVDTHEKRPQHTTQKLLPNRQTHPVRTVSKQGQDRYIAMQITYTAHVPWHSPDRQATNMTLSPRSQASWMFRALCCTLHRRLHLSSFAGPLKIHPPTLPEMKSKIGLLLPM